MSGKVCTRCGVFCPEGKFKITGRKLSGKVYFKGICSDCAAQETCDGRKLRKLHPPTLGAGCECCGRDRRLFVDHCHTTGRFRGHICQQCNVGLGNLGDDEAGLLRAIRYLCKDAASPRGEEVGVQAAARALSTVSQQGMLPGSFWLGQIDDAH